MHDQVAHARAEGALVARSPDQECRSDRNAFPEDKQSYEIAGENGAKRAAGIDQGGHVLQRILHVQRVDDAEQRGDEEDVAEQQTEPIDAQGRQREIEQLHLAQLAVRQRQQVCKRQDGQHQHIGAAQPRPEAGGR